MASKLLMGTLFRGFDERTSEFLPRFKVSCANALRNVVEKLTEQKAESANRRHHRVRACGTVIPVHDDEQMIEDFRKLLQSRLGDLGSKLFSTSG